MTAFNYSATAATATRLLARFGAACILHRYSAGAYNPATGASAPTYTDIVTTAAVFAYDQQYIDGTLIRQGDQLAYCAPATEPKQGDQLTWQSVKYTVVSAKPVSPAGVPVLFEAQIRA